MAGMAERDDPEVIGRRVQQLRTERGLTQRQLAEPAYTPAYISTLEAGRPPAAVAEAPPAYQPVSLEEVEKLHILATLQHTGWNKSRSASILGIERSTLDRKIRRFELKRTKAAQSGSGPL